MVNGSVVLLPLLGSLDCEEVCWEFCFGGGDVELKSEQLGSTEIAAAGKNHEKQGENGWSCTQLQHKFCSCNVAAVQLRQLQNNKKRPVFED